MLSTWRDIAVFLDASPQGEKIGRDAAMLAKRHKAHLVGIYGVSRLGDHHSYYVRGEKAIQQMLSHQRTADEQKTLEAGRHFAELTRTIEIGSEFRVAWQDSSDDHAVLRGLHCDLIVAAHPQPPDLPSGWSAEHLLLHTGTPVLLVPASWTGEAIGDVVTIAWNRSREARRAVNDAMPFLADAKQITILTIDGDRDVQRFGDNPGTNLLQHLTRHDIKAEIAQVDSNGTPVAEVILSEATRQGATLLVVGAYSRPRTSELLFGGTTRSLLSKAHIPMLISR